MLKRVAIMLFCLMMVFVATFGFVVGVVAVPTIYSYAETTNNFEPIRDQSDAVYAFQAYCKSRDLTIEGSISDAVTSYTTDAYNYTCNKIGVNPTELQSQIQAEYDQAGKPVKFLFSATGIDIFNRLFSQFLQDNELEVGDTADQQNNTVYSGKYYSTYEGYGCLSFVGSSYEFTNQSTNQESTYIQQYGTYLKYSNSELSDSAINGTSLNAFVLSPTITYPINVNYSTVGFPHCYFTSNEVLSNYFWVNSQTRESNGYYSVLYNPSNGYTYLVTYSYFVNKISANNILYSGKINTLRRLDNIDGFVDKPANIYIYSPTINNNNYEGDTYITNEGDVIVEPDPVPPGGTDPGWDIGGGGGTATDGNGNTWNIQFPDFELPDLNIDWSINGLGEKFPFSIPFDLVALVTVLNAEPQAPRFEGTVNFGFTTWNYDINLQQFDSVAQACRIAELLLLVVGLILVTRSIIKG